MALGDNDGALICRKDMSPEIRLMFVLHEWSTMGWFTRSIGHEILWFTVTVVTVMPLSDERSLYEIDDEVLQQWNALHYNVARRIDDLLTLMIFPYHEQNYLQGFTKHALLLCQWHHGAVCRPTGESTYRVYAYTEHMPMLSRCSINLNSSICSLV